MVWSIGVDKLVNTVVDCDTLLLSVHHVYIFQAPVLSINIAQKSAQTVVAQRPQVFNLNGQMLNPAFFTECYYTLPSPVILTIAPKQATVVNLWKAEKQSINAAVSSPNVVISSYIRASVQNLTVGEVNPSVVYDQILTVSRQLITTEQKPDTHVVSKSLAFAILTTTLHDATVSFPETVSIIGPDEDFETIQAWYNHFNVSTMSGHHLGYIRAKGMSVYAGATFSEPAFTQDSTHYFDLRAYPGEEFRGTYNDYSPTYPIVEQLIFTNQKYFIVRGISFEITTSASSPGESIVGLDITGQNIIVENCGIDLYSTGVDVSAVGIRCIPNANNTTVSTIRNCVFRSIIAQDSVGNEGSLACAIIAGSANTGTTLNVYNCLINNVDCTVLNVGRANAIGISGANLINRIGTLRIYNTFIGTPTIDSPTTGTSHKISAGFLSNGVWEVVTAPTYDCGFNGTDDSSIEQGTDNQLSIVLADEIMDISSSTFNAHMKPASTKFRLKGKDLVFAEKPSPSSADIDGNPWDLKNH